MKLSRWTIACIIVVLIYSGFITYEWKKSEEMEEDVMSYAIGLADIPLKELAEAGSMFEYLIEHNATSEILRERITTYTFHARDLSYSSKILYTLTRDKKYEIFGTAMKNLKSFFISVKNRPNCEEILRNNIDTMKQMEYVLDTVRRIKDLKYSDAEKILEISHELKS